MSYPFKYALRRMRIGMLDSIVPDLINAEVPYEKDVCCENTWIFEFPIKCDGAEYSPSVQEVSLETQLKLQATIQRCWSDNSVSATIMFDKKTESDQLWPMIQKYLPQLKGIAFFPRTTETVYLQRPFEYISKEDYDKRVSRIKPVKWVNAMKKLSHGYDQLFCSNDSCELPMP